MSTPPESRDQGYEELYEGFDSPLQQQLRREAYGRDIGQHSWVTAEEIEEDIPRLKLTRDSRILDLGCGPGGPLTFIIERVRCRGTGIDVSSKAIAAGRARVASHGVHEFASLHEADLNQPLPFESGSFDTVVSLDVILHLKNRLEVFREIARVLVLGGRFLFTDAGVVTAAVSEEEIRRRALHGYTQFVPPHYNEQMLEQAGFRLLHCENRSASLLKNAKGRLAARLAHRAELQRLEGATYFERQINYLETVIATSQRGALARMTYLVESIARSS